MSNLSIGDTVTVKEGSGIDSGKQGKIVSRSTAIESGFDINAYRLGRSSNVGKVSFILLDNGQVTEMYNSRLVKGRYPRFHERISDILPKCMR